MAVCPQCAFEITPDIGETFKGACHATAGALVAVMAVYNLYAYSQRHKSHLLGNALLYGSLIVWEATKTYQHWSGQSQV